MTLPCPPLFTKRQPRVSCPPFASQNNVTDTVVIVQSQRFEGGDAPGETRNARSSG